MSFLRDPKRLIATLIAGIAGLFVLLDYVGQNASLDVFGQMVLSWAAVLTALALLVGLLSVAGNHMMRVVRRSADWGYSLLLLVSMLAVVISGTVIGIVTTPSGEVGYVLFPSSLVEQPVRDLFRALYQPLASSFLALLTFFSLSAALRAVHRRTADALVIVVVALIVLAVSAIPQDAVPLLNGTVGWVSDYRARAGARALLIGTALGAVIAGVRVLFGFDQPYLDR
jgi:hypothetical protein